MNQKSAGKKSTKETVGCRLEEEYRHALAAEAAQRGVKMGEVMRELIIGGLQEKEVRQRLFTALVNIHNELRETRRDHAMMAEALLTSAGKLDSARAQRWASDHIFAD